MRIACVAVPSFTVAIERQASPRLAEQPLVVYARNTVLESAGAPGVRSGASLRQAKALCPHAVFVEADHARYRRAFESMLEALECVAPQIEPAGPGRAYADVRGLLGHYADEFALAGALAGAVSNATGLLPSVGIADGKFVAGVAAWLSPPGDAGIVLSGGEREFLRDCSVALLPFAPEVVQRLELLALHRLGDVAELPRPAVEAQFRSIGRRLWELANGFDSEPLRPRRRQESLHEQLSFEAPVATSEALIAAGQLITRRLVRRLRGRTARRMHVQLLADDRIVWERPDTFREPAGDQRQILLLLKTRLSLVELAQAVDTVAITLSGLGREVAKQAKLFSDVNPNLQQIGEAIRQLRARYGRPVVWRIAEVDGQSRHPERRAMLVEFDG